MTSKYFAFLKKTLQLKDYIDRY